MVKRHTSLFLVPLIACLALLCSGCGGGGGSTFNPPPYSRNTGPASQSQDLSAALDNADAPTGKDLLALISSEYDLEYYLNDLNIPADAAGYYPLLTGSAFTRGRIGAKSPFMAKNEVAIAGLAKALARGARRGTRDTIPIDFIGDDGVHWQGSYSNNTIGSANTISMNVTGTRDNLTVVIHIVSTSDSVLSDNGSQTDSTFTYTFTVNGTVGDIANPATIAWTASGSGSTSDRVTFSPSTANGSMYENTAYQISVNTQIVNKSTTALNYTYAITDGINYDSTLTYTADAWLFAEDSYWVHATTNISDTNAGYIAGFTVVASDGYRLTFDGSSGTLTDADGIVLANLSYDSTEYAIKVDFTLEMETQGAPDYVYICLSRLEGT